MGQTKGKCNNTSKSFVFFASNEENTLEDHIKAITIINAEMYKGICKCNCSRFRNETLNIVKFTELKETSFYNK